MRISVEAVNPDSPLQWVKIHNKKTNQTREAKGALKKDERYVLYFQLYVQDYSNMLSSQVTRVLVCETGPGLLRGIKPEDIIKKRDVQDKVKEVMSNLCKFNVWMEAAVEVNEEGYLVINHTEINEY